MIQTEEVWIEVGPNAVVSGMAEKIPPTNYKIVQALLNGYTLVEMDAYSTLSDIRLIQDNGSDWENMKCLPLQKS